MLFFFIWLCFFTYDLNNIIHARVRLICLFVTFFLWINRFKGDFCRLRGLEFFSGFSPNSLIYFYYFLFGISYTYYFLIIFFICTFKRKNISCAKKWRGGSYVPALMLKKRETIINTCTSSNQM